MTDFWQAERLKLQLAAGGAALWYVIAMLLLWGRLKHNGASYVYPLVNGRPDLSHPESFARWLEPWAMNLLLATAGLLVASVTAIYFRSYRGKGACEDCLAEGVSNFIRTYLGADDGDRTYICRRHVAERHERDAVAMVRARAYETEGEVLCPYCRQPMMKTVLVIQLGYEIIFVVCDDCEKDGRFNSWDEERVLMESAERQGYDRAMAAHKRRGLIASAPTLHAHTVPLSALQDSEPA